MAVVDLKYADSVTDKELAKLERKLNGIYRQATKELKQRYKEYIEGWDEVVNGKKIHHKGFNERYAEELKAYAEGKYDDNQWNEWLMSQIGRGERWKALQEDMASRLTHTNIMAASYINDALPDVYSLNYNYAAYQIEQVGKLTAFNVVNPATVRLLATEDRIALPTCSIKIPKDLAWNKKKLQGALLQGILQGDSIPKIADRFQQVAYMNRSAAIRNARTTFTGAQNRGKQAVFDQCEKMGTTLQKEWISAGDARTRDSHRMLDGVRVDNGKKFPNGLEYPGDVSSGKPHEVYNCRCAMRAILPDINDEKRTGNTVETYLQWKREKENSILVAPTPKVTNVPTVDVKTREEAKQRLLKLGFNSISDNVSNIDEQLLCENVNNISRLEERFGCISNSFGFFSASNKGSGTRACIEHRLIDPSIQSMYLCRSSFGNRNELIKSSERDDNTFWHMPCSKEMYSVYTATHEYGHMLQNILLKKKFEKDGWKKEKASEMIDVTKSTSKARFKWYYKEDEEFSKECYNEIVDIAKDSNPYFILTENISRYGRSNYHEFFAEVFANAMCGKPNELGKAMLKWLAKKGL